MARNGDHPPLPYSSTTAMPNRQPTMRGGGTMKRSKTLTRPDRHVAQIPLINPAQAGAAGAAAEANGWWTYTSWVVTFWAPGALLSVCGIKDAQSQQAWREKITLVFIALVMGGFIGFATMGLQSVLCPGGSGNQNIQLMGSTPGTLSVGGFAFNISSSSTSGNVNFISIAKAMPGQDITTRFTRTAADYPLCKSSARYASSPICSSGSPTDCVLSQPSASTLSSLKLANTTKWEGYSWDQVANLANYIVIDGLVLNMNPYIAANPKALANDTVDTILRRAFNNQSSSGKDLTLQFHARQELRDAIPCLTSRYLAGRIDKMTPGCFVAALFLYASLIVILSVVLIRFFMALIFNWFLSTRLVKKHAKRGAGISPTVLPEGANVSVNNQTGTAPWAASGAQQSQHMMSLAGIGSELFTVCLVTCYSEGEESIRGTIESVAATNYPDTRKLIWVVCDGMITGAGEKQSTPDICVGMLEADPRFGNPQPMGYIAVGSGAKHENRAMVYAGHYLTKNGHRTPTIMVVKCGMPSEASEKKPGNRGKRDSQLILMNFFSRVTYNDRMTPLDYDIFRKVQTLMGVTPDFFEVCLMVDADTKVFPDSMGYLVNSMANDNMVMGVCGETRIANKRQSWVTAIQVYEYFISHHHTKAFESVFGGVTCLPGCFSMYRIKARRDGDEDWVPILVKPEIVREYSQSDVVSLHQKNLLLLGEDRFLSTILLRTFPNRRNIFVPQARCRTVAPDTFSVLLSQRRRWINSTVHNLMELVLVRDLCGTFCFSMQFVVFMDLIGTVVLPIAICLTVALIINSIIKPPHSFEEAIPLMLLGCVLGLPAFLILITTRKAIYVAWMVIYLFALPIWNFVLPVYSFWHFDDFSWGETRKVEGEVVDKSGHSAETAVFDGTTVPLRRWDDWERSRLRKLRREEKRRRQMEKMHGRGFYGEDGTLPTPDRGFARDYDSDCGSVVSSEEDMWGGDIGGYDENNPAYPPPPQTITADQPRSSYGGPVLGLNDMAALLDQGFEEPAPAQTRPDRNAPSPLYRGYQAAQTRSPTGSGSGKSSPIGYVPEQYAALTRNSPVMGAQSTAIESNSHAGSHTRQRSTGGVQNLPGSPDGGNYGPLGPLDNGGNFNYGKRI